MMQGIKGALQPVPDGAHSYQLSLNGLDWPSNEPVFCIAVEYIKDNCKLPPVSMAGSQMTQLSPTSTQVYTHLDNQSHIDMLDPNMPSVAHYGPMYTEDGMQPVVVRQSSPDDFMQMVPSEPGAGSDQDGDILITDQATGISYLVERCLDDAQLMDTDTLLDSDLLALDENALKTQLSEIIVEPTLSVGELPKEVIDSYEEIAPCVQQICDRPIQTRARASLPISHLIINQNHRGDESVFAKKFIPSRTQFGPIEGVLSMENIKFEQEQVNLSIDTNNVLQRLDVSNENLSNWMCFVRLAPKFAQQNLILFQQDNNLYFRTTKNIQPKQELLVGYSISYAQLRNLPVLEHEIDDEDLWPCYECPLKFLSSEELQKHLETHDDLLNGLCNGTTRRKKFLCTECAFECTTQLELDNHAVCHLEQTATTNSSNLPNQNQNSGVETTPEPQTQLQQTRKKEEFKCPKCYKCFATSDRIQRHMMVHGDEATKPLKCDKCHKRFLNNSALSCHLKTHLFGAKVYECPICKESFQHILQLKSHVSKHSVDGKFTCPHCKKVFVKYSIIRKHIRAFHCDKVHSCAHCEKAFPTSDKLRMHNLKHSDHREFLCADCGKQFKRKDKLREHCKKMHNEESEVENAARKQAKSEPTDYHRFIYKCHTCLLGFKRRGMLVNHLAKKHPDISPDTVPELNLPIYRTTKDYYCNYCDKIYKSSSKRKAHILKNHPGMALPLGHRGVDIKATGLPNPTYSQTVGSITTRPQACGWCHRQYASKAKLLQHQRKKHADLLEMEKQLDNNSGCLAANEDANLLGDVCNVGGVTDEGYYQLISIANEAEVDIANDEKLYRLVDIDSG